jgi:hypothetical protein
MEAALKGSKQIGFTVISLTVSLDRGLHSAALHDGHRRDACFASSPSR